MIPFNKPVWLGSEPARIAEAIRDNGHVASGGPFGARAEALLSAWIGRRTLLTSSGTHALEMAALLLDVKPGDEIVLPSFTFVSTANAFALRGATLTFVDVDSNGNIDPDAVADALGAATCAVVAVHYAGNSCDMRRLLEIAGGVPVIEDAAQALGSAFDGVPLGALGLTAAISFHETKNVGSGEGGALLLGDDALAERALLLRDKGTNRQAFLRGEVDRYSWVDLGSSYGLSDLLAAYLIDQLEAREQIQARRRACHEAYDAALSASLGRVGGYVVRPHPKNEPNHHLFGMVFADQGQRDGFIAHMRCHEIVTPFHYVALHSSPMGRRFSSRPASLPNTDRLSTCLVRLPLFFNLTDAERDEVIGRSLEYLDGL